MIIDYNQVCTCGDCPRCGRFYLSNDELERIKKDKEREYRRAEAKERIRNKTKKPYFRKFDKKHY